MTADDPQRRSLAVEQAAAYDDWYGQWTSSEIDLRIFPYHRGALEIAGDICRGARVLDMGCGDGRLTRELVLRGASEVVAMDISEVALSIARKRNAAHLDRISFRTASIESIPEPDGSFPAVFCCETVEHVLSPPTALSELHRVLAPGGALILTTPNYMSLLGLLRSSNRLRRRRYTEGGQPVNRLTMLPRTAWWIHRAGFQIQRVHVNGHHLPRRGREARKLEFPRPLAWALWPFGEQTVFLATPRPT